jgi:hypothetical protein
MPKHKRKLGDAFELIPFAEGEVEIRVADTARFDFDANLAGAGFGKWTVFELNGLIE